MSVAPVATPPTLEKLLWNWQGHNIYYTVAGTGKPIVLLHGFGASIGHWRKNIPALAAGGYQVFALDLLGFGASDKAPAAYSMELWQELVVDFCSEKVQEPAVFVGNSIGALLSLMLVANYPDISSGGVLLNCAGGLNHRPEELRFPLRQIMGFFTKLVASPGVGPFLFDRIRQKHRLRNTLRQVYGNKEAITTELIEMIYEPTNHPGAQEVFAAILTAPPGPQPSELLPKVQRPLLVIWGEDDPWTPVAGASIFQEFASKINLQFTTIPKTGHCPHDERPEEVNRLILSWLRDN
ncbi:MAG TPA: alpha/beta fold hydrolase [Oscillatoriaceae cyanobacterium M33_DOE_052]|uniref:Alpha/beta fold hydrolase n=1 Tax=Planktothricoides sp. SpSt-374 TaxID=2282167 RepID=A0A7C3ZJU1_9CYAN|nr:alpha/beta fold hydrolase [Oscillatoriaceae cyanobacterium M33_DOE_052]